MKALKNIAMSALLLTAMGSCTDLDRFPLDSPSSETWYQTEAQFDMALADFFRPTYTVWWGMSNIAWTDDMQYRNMVQGPIDDGSLNSETNKDGYLQLHTFYQNKYKCISRANAIINNIERGRAAGISEAKLKLYEANARLARACMYGELTFYFGDVVYTDQVITIEEAQAKGRTPKAEVLEKMWPDFDYAIANLDENVQGTQTMTKGAALALKARYALYNGDYAECARCSQEVMKMSRYRLHPDFYQYFQENNDAESIFCIPSNPENSINAVQSATSWIPRYSVWGGSCAKNPTWALLASFECIDGLPIDQSPLFNPREPFENRDPRCGSTIIPFNSRFFDYQYDPRPNTATVMDYNLNKKVKNIDRFPEGNANCSYNALLFKKRVRTSWQKGQKPDNDRVVIRLADVMLMYAEAKIELNQIDQTVLDAINKVRARAYKCDVTAGVSIGTAAVVGQSYPQVTTTDQSELRRIVRRERRVELAFEDLRYQDLIRWHIAHIIIPGQYPGLLNDKVANKANESKYWFWPRGDENGQTGGKMDYIKVDRPADGSYEKYSFDKMIEEKIYISANTKVFPERQYLFPIPLKERLVNPNITQNPGYGE